MPDQEHRDPENDALHPGGAYIQRTFIHRILRYVPTPLREEWINIGVLLYDPNTGDRRLRLIREDGEYRRLRRLRPSIDERVLRYMRDHLESRLSAATPSSGTDRSQLRNGPRNAFSTDWFQILEKWDATLSNSLQLSEPGATVAEDIDAEIDRIYDEQVAALSSGVRIEADALRTRPQMRNYMDQVFRQAGLWGLIQKFVPVSEFTLDNDPMLIDYSYLRSDNKVRGFVQTISLTNKPEDVRIFAPLAKTIQERAPRPKPHLIPEFTAVTDIPFEDNSDHRFLETMLEGNGITAIPLDNFAVWVAKLRPMVQ
jgi:DUF3037 family protein